MANKTLFYLAVLLGMVAVTNAQSCALFDNIENEAGESQFPPTIALGASQFTSVGQFRLVAQVSKWYDQASDVLLFEGADNTNLNVNENVGLSDDCWIAYNLDIAWSDLLAGLDRDDSQANSVKFRGSASVHSEVTLIGELYGNEMLRESDEVLLFEINFPKSVVVTANIEAFSIIEIQVTLLSHAINIDALAVASDNADVSATLSVATTVQFPFLLRSDNIAVSTTSAGVAIDATGIVLLSAADCADDASECVQTWTFSTEVFDVLTGGCTLEGDFDIAFEYICHPSEADCPIDDASRTGTSTVSITSADLCPATVVDVGLSGTLASYEDAGFAIPRAAFIVGQTTHFLAETESSDAEIIATSILTIQHELSGAVTLLYDADTNFSLAGANVVIDAATGNPNTATFSFDIAEAVFVVPRFSSDTFTISATLDVDFDGFALLMKRAATETKSNGNSIELLQAPAGGDQPVDSSTQLEIGSNAVDEGAVGNNAVVVQETDAANSSLVYVVVGVLAVVGIAIIGAVVYLRRSSKKGQQQIAIQPQVQMQQVQGQYITPQQQQPQVQMQMPVHQMQMPQQMQMPVQLQQMPMQQQQMAPAPMQA